MLVGVLQSAVLVAGTATCLLAVIGKTPGGVSEIVELGVANDKFSLGSFGPSLMMPTFWVIFAYGIAINLGNFGTDQGFIQRFITARSDREAAKSIWITAALFMPTSAVFFFIGTALYAFYTANPTLVAGIDKPDEIFPHFIATELPAGVSGLVVAAIFAAAMDSNLNSMATLTLCDLYKRYWRPEAEDRESMRVLLITVTVPLATLPSRPLTYSSRTEPARCALRCSTRTKAMLCSSREGSAGTRSWIPQN